MRSLTVLTYACLLALLQTVTAADAAGRRIADPAAWIHGGPLYGGYYRTVPLTPYAAWDRDGPPYGGYYRSAPRIVGDWPIRHAGVVYYPRPRRY